ncbi:hypothetical protein RJ639_016244 [Escallonia herrerae]|uniref:GPI ethanolamine phosphate transferase 3 n=1 Tax=Escallonia herrerae TaxID=1293975 RepID=A0AA88VBT1_9ASTE|nr:hypothetical protein RJ639_016244 [Escallonia herrerae]
MIFLVKDHAGHIFGVDSLPMIEKLQQYNGMLEKVVDVLESQSRPGGLHENTLLLVMGDHGQTINGDHGGGSAEEVETSIFAMSMKKPAPSFLWELDNSSCRMDLPSRSSRIVSSLRLLVAAMKYFLHIGVARSASAISGHLRKYALGLLAETAMLGRKPSDSSVSCLDQTVKAKWFSLQLRRKDKAEIERGMSNEDLVSPENVFLDGREVCISSMEQLDFAVTVSALLGLPFPFGSLFCFSIGRVNPVLYALATGIWKQTSYSVGDPQSPSNLEVWMQNYVDVLCINSWQVKKYIDVYSASSVIGFSNEDLLHVAKLYAQAEENWLHTLNDLAQCKSGSCYASLGSLKRQIVLYSDFFASVAELARTKWTEFDLKRMGIGFGIMLASMFFHLLAILWVDKQCMVSFTSHSSSRISFGLIFSSIIVAIRAVSFLSNSFILEEAKVANFLLATTGMLYLRHSTLRNKMVLEALAFLLLISILKLVIELGVSKQGVDSPFLKMSLSWMPCIDKDSPFWMCVADSIPMLALFALNYMLYQSIARNLCQGISKYIVSGTIFSHMLITVHWALESNLLTVPLVLKGIRGDYIPRIIYAIGVAQLLSLTPVRLFEEDVASDWEERIVNKTVGMLSAWSPTVVILSGKQGWFIMRFKSLKQDSGIGTAGLLTLNTSSVTQWSLFATCLFFCTGHWCAFDGLRYGAAFIGFDEFNLIRQAILLTIDTFGFSHILPVFGLPFLVVYRYPFGQAEKKKQFFFLQLCHVYLIYGLVMATTVTFTIICVALQRRHLMVWGLFAPKFVFDVVGLTLTDFMICVASLFYFGPLCIRGYDLIDAGGSGLPIAENGDELVPVLKHNFGSST